MDDSMRSVVLAAVGADLAALVGGPGRRRGTGPGDGRRDGARRGVGDRGAVAGGGHGGAWGGQDGRTPPLSLRWGGRLRGLSDEGGADGGGLDHGAPRLLCLPRLWAGQLSARCGAGAAARQPQSRGAAAGLPVRGALPFAEAARAWPRRPRVRLSASTVRTVTEAVGARREQDLAAAIAAAWAQGLPPRDADRRRIGCTWPWMGCASWAPTGPGARSRSGWCSRSRSTAGGERRERGQLRGGTGKRRQLRAAAGVGGASAGLEGAGPDRRAGRRRRVDLAPRGGTLPRRGPHRRLVPRQRADLGVGPRPVWGRDTDDDGLGRAAIGTAGAWPGGHPGRTSGGRCPVAARRRPCAMRR